VIFAGRRKAEKLDLEAVEMATRAALHRAGAAGLEELLAAEGECSYHGQWLSIRGLFP
jgi:hypothetical protein